MISRVSNWWKSRKSPDCLDYESSLSDSSLSNYSQRKGSSSEQERLLQEWKTADSLIKSQMAKIKKLGSAVTDEIRRAEEDKLADAIVDKIRIGKLLENSYSPRTSGLSSLSGSPYSSPSPSSSGDSSLSPPPLPPPPESSSPASSVDEVLSTAT